MPKASLKVGKFMIAIGAIIENQSTGKILICQREGSDWLKGHWESIYGRIDNHEELDIALKREVFEETGIKDIKIKKLVRIWHLYRGEKKIDNELYGLTFYCQTKCQKVKLSREHKQFLWVTPKEALKYIKRRGMQIDIEVFMKDKAKSYINVTNLHDKTKIY